MGPWFRIAAPTEPVRKREIFGWAMYDFANSSYTTVVISVVYSAFFVGYIVPDTGGPRDSYWAIAILLSTILSLVLAPLAGAICDYSGKKKIYLLMTTVICAVSTMALITAGPGMVWWAIFLVVISNAAFNLGETFCGSFLTDLSDERNMAKISGIGWGVGYFGGMLSIVIVTMIIISADPTEDLATYVTQNQWSMVAIGCFFALASIPTFVLVRSRSAPKPGFENAGFRKLMKVGMDEMRQSVETARSNPVLFRFLLAFMVYMAGLDAIIKFVGIYASLEVKLSMDELGFLFIVIQLSAAAGAFGFGYIERFLGPKRTVLLTLAWWVLAGLGIFFLDAFAALLGMDPKRAFMIVALVAGSGIGATQSSSRAIVGLLSPPGKSAQMFGFWGMFARTASLLAVSFGFAADFMGSRRMAILLVIAFFVVGALMLLPIDVDGEARRRSAERVEAAKNAVL